MKSPPAFIILVSLLIVTNPCRAGLPHIFPNVSSIPPTQLPNITAGAWNSFQKLLGCQAGQKVDGLAKLKDYFRYFGYTTKLGNLTDEFDEELTAALKTYQHNFNLNITGNIDEPTLKQLIKPRCGNADIINGTSSMNSGKAQSQNSLIHLHTVAHYSYFPGQPRWPQSNTELTYAFSPENQLSDAVKTVFANAFDRWSEVTPLTFSETSSFSTADIRIGFFSGDHGDGEPFDGPLGTLAHAFSPPSGRFHLDSDEDWVTDVDSLNPPVTRAVDLESVAVHEIGHLLGLGHSSVEDAIMYPSIVSGTRKVELASDDIEGIQQLYGSNPNYTGPTFSTGTQERDSSASHFGSPLWVLRILFVGFVLFLL